jgi:hypothetical protein
MMFLLVQGITEKGFGRTAQFWHPIPVRTSLTFPKTNATAFVKLLVARYRVIQTRSRGKLQLFIRVE